MKIRTCALLVTAVMSSWAAGGEPERFQRVSDPIVTPHVAWAKPLPGGPLKALCLTPIPGQRDVVELAQRLDLEYDLVTFQDPLLHDDVANEFGKLLAEKSYDIVLLSKAPLAKLPEQTQRLLVAKARQGTGVLNVEATATLHTGEVIHAADSAAFLEIGLPLDRLPEGCRPDIHTGRCGEGRIVSLSYAARVGCLTPLVPFEQVDYRDWEAYYQLLCRAAVWAAKREAVATIDTLWPAATTTRQPASSWRMEQLVCTRRPRWDRAGDRWQVESVEERISLPTWRGYGASVAEDQGKLKIAHKNVCADSGFAVGTFAVDWRRTPIVEVAVGKASRWSLFIPDAQMDHVLAVLEPETDATGTRRYDLRQVEKLDPAAPLRLAFSTFGKGTSLVLDSLKFLTAEGKPLEQASSSATAFDSGEVVLRLEGRMDGPAVVTAIYRGADYYVPTSQQEQQITLVKGQATEVRFPMPARTGGRTHAVDMMVRDAQGRSLAFATAAYEVVAPVKLVSWASARDFFQRGDEVAMVATFQNDTSACEVDVTAECSDMYGRLVSKLTRRLAIPSGASEQQLAFPSDRSLTTLNRVRLWVSDGNGPLLETETYVYLPELVPAWDDYLVSTSQFSRTSPYLRPYALEFVRGFGIEGQVIPLSHTLEALQQAAPVMYWGAADVRAFGYNFHGEETSTARRPCLSDPEVREKIAASYEKLGEVLKPYGPMALASLEDESELTGARYANLEVCTSEFCTARYRQWLKEQYGTVDAMNREWDTSYATFEEIERMTYQEARKAANPAPWIDWRTFMEHVWLDALLLTRNGVKKDYPDIRMGFSNSFGQMPFSGWNFETLSRHVDMTIEYPTIIDHLTPPKADDAFEADVVAMSEIIRQKLDIRRSFMPEGSPSPGWIWYDRSEQGAEFRPWWMAFQGAKGCTPWGPDSLGVRQGAKSMAFWAFVHPQLAHTRSSAWLASGIEDLTRGVGKIFVDYQRAGDPVAVLYSQPSMHLAWAWSDVESAFYPDPTSLYAWYYRSRVNTTRLLRELGFTYRYVGTSEIEAGNLDKYRVLFLPCSLCLSDATMEHIRRFVEAGGLVVADLGAGAADGRGKPIAHRESVEQLFGISRDAVCRTMKPDTLEVVGKPRIESLAGLKLAGADAITSRAEVAVAHADKTPAVVVNPVGKGKAVYLNGFLGYNMMSRQLIRAMLASASVESPVRVTSGGNERMGYEATTFRRGNVEILGVLRLCEEQGPTEVHIGRKAHLYDVRGGRYFGLTDTATFDLTQKAAAVLAILPYQIGGVSLKASPEEVERGETVSLDADLLILRLSSDLAPQMEERGALPQAGDHVLRIEVFDPAGRLSRAYTANVLATSGERRYRLQTALNEQPGRWRAVVTDVISGKKAETVFVVTESPH